MSTVIGLKSGREFVVKDKSYLFINKDTGSFTRVFLLVDEKRVITIPPDGSIEFFDEPMTENTLKDLEATKLMTYDKVTEDNEEDYDPNVR